MIDKGDPLMIDFSGWLGSLLLALCGLPLAWEALTKKQIQVNFWFLTFWTLGEVLVLVYVLSRQDFPLMVNYLLNLILLTPVWWYRKP